MKALRFDLKFDLKDLGFQKNEDLRLEIWLSDFNTIPYGKHLRCEEKNEIRFQICPSLSWIS